MEESDDVTLSFGEEDELDKKQVYRHPVALLFHLAFKSAALLAYILCGFFSSSFITNFIVIVLLLSMDFWTVKNITGRLLVGLRWWNHVDDNGEGHWVYESRKGIHNNRMISAVESHIFWASIFVAEILWGFFFIASLFRLNIKWLIVVTVGIIMNGANLYGYIRCKLGSNQKMGSAARNFISSQFIKSIFTPFSSNSDTSTETMSQPNQPQS